MDSSSATNTPMDAAPPTTWSFVQMNMSLLPIARPLPVATACPRRLLHEELEQRKPRTPTQKLHRRVLRSAANISPRRHDLHSSTTGNSGGGVRRLSNTSLLTAASSRPPPIDPSAWTSPPVRVRCQSEELVAKRGVGVGVSSGYASDGSARPTTLASASNEATAYKGKRILELLDEERRLSPDERSGPSPTKRSRLQR